MKRATYTQFRDPRERTPAAMAVQVTCDGTQLFNSEDLRIRNTSKHRMSRSKRFEEFQSVRKSMHQGGPAAYHPLTDLVD